MKRSNNSLTKNKKKETVHASITIYLTLMLVLVMALICTLIESGRVSAMNARLQSISYMAADSCFAEFAEPLFSDYGVMFLWCDEEELIEKYNAYVAGNLSLEGSGARNDIELYGMQHIDSVCTDITWATDRNGEVFAEQVETYMKYHLTENILEKLLSKLGIFEQSDQVQYFLDKIQDYKKIFVKVEEAVTKIQTKIDKAKDLAANPKGILAKMQQILNEYEEDPDESLPTAFMQEMNELRQTKKDLTDCLEDIRKETKNYYDSMADAKVKVDEIDEELEEKKENYNEEVYQTIKEEVDDIRTKSADTDADYYHVIENETLTNTYIGKLNELDSFFSATQSALSEENLTDYQNLVTAYQEKFADFDVNSLGVDLEVLQVAAEDDGFIDEIYDLLSSGFLTFLAGEVSEKKTDTTAFPSVTVGKVSAEDTDQEKESLLSLAANKALFSEYVIEHLGNYLHAKEGSVLDYEAEYVLGGKKSDQENLSSVIGKLVLIRSGMNLISLLKDAKKKAETYELATAIIGFTGQPILIKIVQLLIIGAWSVAESFADVKVLLQGNKVATIKKEADWNLSLEGIRNFTTDSIAGKDCEKGLGYEDYLRILLLMQNRTKQYFRTMDVLQANMCANENERFRFKDSIDAVSLQVRYRANVLFPTLPLANKVISISKGTYLFQYIQEYQY
ncbi:MAG: hypothetical protein J5483_04505 [Lachnospiraceae bacterium]|nr:hypothetical protein [Lachnospiraceae bacterium]